MREAVYQLRTNVTENCVKALTSGKATPYLPYADSKLTMMLSSGLGEDGKSSVIVCAAQEQEHAAETVQAEVRPSLPENH